MIKTAKGIENPQQTGGVIGRRNEQYIDRPTPTPTPKKDKPANKVKVSKKKDNKSENYWKAPMYESKSEKKKKKNDPLKIHGKNPSAIQKKLIKAGFTTKELETLVTNYNEKYRNKRGW